MEPGGTRKTSGCKSPSVLNYVTNIDSALANNPLSPSLTGSKFINKIPKMIDIRVVISVISRLKGSLLVTNLALNLVIIRLQLTAATLGHFAFY
jgi:hypothetical protein